MVNVLGFVMMIFADFGTVFPTANLAVGVRMIDKAPKGSYLPKQAMCHHNRNSAKKPTIYINLNWWKTETNVYVKKKVIFHELGHCSLDLRHAGEGIMDTKLSTVKRDGSNWNKLVSDLKREVEGNAEMWERFTIRSSR